MSCNQNQNTTSNLSDVHKGLLGLDIDYLKSKMMVGILILEI